VSLGQQDFAAFMKYLALHDYQAIALRDLGKYVDPEITPQDALEIIDIRRRQIAK
jgi:hypothetical protein